MSAICHRDVVRFKQFWISWLSTTDVFKRHRSISPHNTSVDRGYLAITDWIWLSKSSKSAVSWCTVVLGTLYAGATSIVLFLAKCTTTHAISNCEAAAPCLASVLLLQISFSSEISWWDVRPGRASYPTLSYGQNCNNTSWHEVLEWNCVKK